VAYKFLKKNNKALKCALIGLTLQASVFAGPIHAQDGELTHPPLSAPDRAAVRCSAIFAIVATEQARGNPALAEVPSLAWRGREYMVRTGARLTSASWTREQVAAAMKEAVAELQTRARDLGDPDALIMQSLPSCLTLLDAEVGPLIEPNLPQCAAIMRRSYEEVHKAEGLSDRAKDLLTLATVLESRARRELAEQGRTSAESDAIIALEQEAVAKIAAQPGGVGRYDLTNCFELAKPEEKKHY